MSDAPLQSNERQSDLTRQFTPLQQAVRARALWTIENQHNQPRLSTRRKLLFASLSLVTVIGLIILINYGVIIMQRIFALWTQDEAPVITQPKVGEPFYITVDPPISSPVNSNQQGDNKADE